MKKGTVKKICTLILAVCIIFVMMLSISYTISHADHHCTGSDCPICYTIHLAEAILKTIGSVVAFICFGALARLILSCYRNETPINNTCSTSLFALKVKLTI